MGRQAKNVLSTKYFIMYSKLDILMQIHFAVKFK